MCESASQDAGRERRHLNAQRYAYMRITARESSALPSRLQFQGHLPKAASYTEFLLGMTAELKTAIDSYLSYWLTFTTPSNQSIPPPVVTWSPTRFVHPEASLGWELADIDVELLHELLATEALSLTTLAAELNRPVRHVRWAIAEFPPSTGRPPTKIDWRDDLPATLPLTSST